MDDAHLCRLITSPRDDSCLFRPRSFRRRPHCAVPNAWSFLRCDPITSQNQGENGPDGGGGGEGGGQGAGDREREVEGAVS